MDDKELETALIEEISREFAKSRAAEGWKFPEGYHAADARLALSVIENNFTIMRKPVIFLNCKFAFTEATNISLSAQSSA